VRVCKKLVTAVNRDTLAYLDEVVTMDETMVSLHTTESKIMLKQWVEKGQPFPIKARVHASPNKIMVLAFVYSKGLTYTNNVPHGTTNNSAFIIKALQVLMKGLRQKRPRIERQGFKLHWDNAPVHTSAAIWDWLAAKDIAVLLHLSNSPDSALADFFLHSESEGVAIKSPGQRQELQDDLGRGGGGRGDR